MSVNLCDFKGFIMVGWGNTRNIHSDNFISDLIPRQLRRINIGKGIAILC